MNINEIDKMAIFEKEYWWHKGKRYLVKKMLEKYFPDRKNLKILEIGCGTGGLTKTLLEYGDVTGLDVSESALEASKINGLKNVLFGDINSIDLSSLAGSFDAVLALDVLEHITNDLEAMKRVRGLLKSDGYFFVNVPAYKFLWSEHDEALSHVRRYHIYELVRKLEDSKFSIVKKSYFVSTVFAGIAFYRIWGNFFGRSAYPKTSYVLLPKFLNDFMTKILELEAEIIMKASLPMGATITVVAQPKKL